MREARKHKGIEPVKAIGSRHDNARDCNYEGAHESPEKAKYAGGETRGGSKTDEGNKGTK
jgi:hypothetical protein